ncbi:MAG: neutral zinc metallopeptidase [Acidimicrobiales bacterium]
MQCWRWSWSQSGALLAVAVLVLTSGACAQEADENPLGGGPTGEDRGGSGDSEPDGSGPVQVPTADLDALVAAAIDDVEAYWTETYPATYGGRLEPLTGGYYPYGPDTETPPCGPAPISYQDIAGNAFYCPTEDLIAWDAATLIPRINETYGAFTVGIVFAHEFAHAIQARADVRGRTIDLELQADCYAGAWTAYVADGGSDTFDVTDHELDSSVAGMVAIRDQPGTNENDPGAHGSAFDRIGAFQEGYENGPRHCATYEGAPRRTFDIPFSSGDQTSADPGNFPLDDSTSSPCPEDLDDRVISGRYDPDTGEASGCGLASFLEADLNVYYAALFEQLGKEWTPIDDLVLADPGRDEISCGGETLSGDELRGAALYCEDENVVVIDRTGLTTDLYRIGDFAFGVEVARLWAIAAQAQVGLDGGDQELSLQADCMTGVYARSISPEVPLGEPDSSLLEISPGDLDEGIQAFVAMGEGLSDEAGSAFERTDALRTGVVEGLEGCERDYGEFA